MTATTTQPSGFISQMTSRLSIAEKSGIVRRFKPNWAQRIYFAEIERQHAERRPVRLINLKARQLGISTATEAYIYCMSFVQSNSKSMVIADDNENSHHLLSMTDLFWELDPLNPLYTTKYQAKNTLAWRETASSIRTTTAGNKRAGRSRTIQRLHASEVAFWERAETVMTGLLQAVPALPNTFISLESTANGIGNYFETQWNQAVNGENEYIPLFFPWWLHPEYRASAVGLPPRDLGHLDAEEKQLLLLFRIGLQMRDRVLKLDEQHWNDALMWRRWAIRNLAQNDILKFHQEYPSTPEEAFISTGTNVFPFEHLQTCYQPLPDRAGRLHREGNKVTFVPDVAGPLHVFKNPSADTDYGMYVIGGDSTHAVHDRAVAQVINRRTYEQVAVWRGRLDPSHFGEEMAKLGMLYNTALLSPENEGPGYATIGALIQLQYPNLHQPQQPENLPGRFTGKYGFSSSHKTKAEAIGWLIKVVVDHDLILHDRMTYDEMRNYVTKPDGGFGPASEETGYDDHVTSLAISIVTNVREGALPAYGLATADVGETAPWESWGEQETGGWGG